jgi:hypothetical protein
VAGRTPVNSTRRAIFGDTNFEFEEHSDLIDELERLLSLERRNPSRRRPAVSARQWDNLAEAYGMSALKCVA